MTKNVRAAALAMAVLSLVSLSTVTIAHAKMVEFKGTRSQVTTACSAIGVETSNWTSNGVGWTGCANADAGTNVSCNDNGDCIGEVPRLITGRLDMGAILALPKARGIAPVSPPPSLSESGTDSTPVPAPAVVPEPAPEVDYGQM